MLMVNLDDGTGRVEAVLRAEQIDELGHLVKKDEVLVVEGEIAPDDFTGGYRLRARDVMDMAGARARFARRLLVRLDARRVDEGRLGELVELVGRHRGGTTQLVIAWRNEAARARAKASNRFAVRPDDVLIESLSTLLGPGSASLLYQ